MYWQIMSSCCCTFPMTKTICTCLSLHSVFLYQLQWHSQHEYSVKNLIIGNGDSTSFIYTFMEGVHLLCSYTLHFSLSYASSLQKLWCLNLNIFLDCWEVCMVYTSLGLWPLDFGCIAIYQANHSSPCYNHIIYLNCNGQLYSYIQTDYELAI